MAIFSDSWSATSSYSTGDQVNYSGVVYTALAGITGAASNTNPCEDTTNWEVSHVERVESLNSLVEMFKLELNTNDERINNTAFEFIHRGSNYVNQRLRPPSNQVSTIVTTTTIPNEGYEERLYIRVPSDLLEVVNLRINSDTPSGYGLVALGTREILAAQSDADFETLQQYFSGNTSLFGYTNLGPFDAPLYRFRTIGGISYFELAPADIGTGTEIEIVYWKAEPQLGTQHPRVNSLGEPLNSAGQTSAQWIAADAANTADNFVQQQVRIESNWYTNNAPYCLLYAALEHGAIWLKDNERAQYFRQKYLEEQENVESWIFAFEENRPTSIQMYNPYSIS